MTYVAVPFPVFLAALPHGARVGRFYNRKLCEIQRIARRSFAGIEHFDRDDALVFRVVDDYTVQLDGVVDGTLGTNSMFRRSRAVSYSSLMGFYPSNIVCRLAKEAAAMNHAVAHSLRLKGVVRR